MGGVVVQPDEHRGVLRDGHDDVVELSQSVLPHRLVLVEHQRDAEDLGDSRGPPEVPEVGHLLFEGAFREDHPVEEPPADSVDLREVVHGGNGRGRHDGGQAQQVRLESRVVDRLVIDELVHRGVQADLDVSFELRRRGAEARPARQMSRGPAVPADAHGLTSSGSWETTGRSRNGLQESYTGRLDDSSRFQVPGSRFQVDP